jgi:nucleotide-binding universal stress UspA family protein
MAAIMGYPANIVGRKYIVVSSRETMLCGPHTLSMGVAAAIIPVPVQRRGGMTMEKTQRTHGAKPALRSLAAAFGNTPPQGRRLKVLLPFDGSAAALNAARYAARNLEGLEARVLLVNVQRVLVDAEMLHAARGIAQLHRLEGEEILRPACELLDSAGIAYDAEVAFGSPARVIVRMAEERGCDLIAIGKRGRHPLVEALTGSVSRRVAANATVPVMQIALSDTQGPPDPRWRGAPYIAA